MKTASDMIIHQSKLPYVTVEEEVKVAELLQKIDTMLGVVGKRPEYLEVKRRILRKYSKNVVDEVIRLLSIEYGFVVWRCHHFKRFTHIRIMWDKVLLSQLRRPESKGGTRNES